MSMDECTAAIAQCKRGAHTDGGGEGAGVGLL